MEKIAIFVTGLIVLSWMMWQLCALYKQGKKPANTLANMVPIGKLPEPTVLQPQQRFWLLRMALKAADMPELFSAPAPNGQPYRFEVNGQEWDPLNNYEQAKELLADIGGCLLNEIGPRGVTKVAYVNQQNSTLEVRVPYNQSLDDVDESEKASCLAAVKLAAQIGKRKAQGWAD